MKKLIVIGSLFFASSAMAQTASPPAAFPTPAAIPTPGPIVTLTETDVSQIKQWIGMSDLSRRFPDGSTHALVDGTALSAFLDKKTEEAKVQANIAAAKDREAKHTAEPPKPVDPPK